jgi:predicted Zn-dependent peptidase
MKPVPISGKKVTDFIEYTLYPGIRLYVYPTNRFKTIIVRVFVHQALSYDKATKGSLLLQVLRRGCRRYQNTRKMVWFLQHLYGASFSTAILKLREQQVLDMQLVLVHQKFLPHNARTFERGLRFFREVILHPVLVRKTLNPQYVDLEKQNLRKYLERMINNRASYALQRCVEEMCKGEPYGVCEHGRLQEIDPITPEVLTRFHHDLLQSAPIDIFISGEVDPDKTAAKVADLFYIKRSPRDIAAIPDPVIKCAEGEQEVIEQKAVEQAKLVIGCRTGTSWSHDGIWAMIMACGILGVFPSSKLFTQIREAQGLAYSVSVRFDESKGVLFIRAGIDPSRYRYTLDCIRQELEKLKQGQIEQDEYESTLRSIINNLRAQQDAPSRKLRTFMELLWNGRPLGIPEMIAHLEAVTPQQASQAANKIKIDTIYLLTPS